MTDGTFVTELSTVLASERAKILTHEGRAWTVDGQGAPREILPHLPRPLGFATLSAIAKFAEQEIGVDQGAFFLVGAGVVKLFEGRDDAEQRPNIAEAGIGLPPLLGAAMGTGWSGPASDTVSAILTEFEPDEGRAALLKVLGNIEAEHVRTQVDDGVSAQVTVRQGIQRRAAATLGPIVTLYSRLLLFPDLREANPDGLPVRFTLRLEGDEDDEPMVKLKVADPELDFRMISLNAARLESLTTLPVLR